MKFNTTLFFRPAGPEELALVRGIRLRHKIKRTRLFL